MKKIMKYKYIIPIIALAGMSLIACDDTKMEWYKDPSHGDVTESELPLQLAEKISRYAPLKDYATDFILGVGMGADLYLSDETYRNIVEQNFVEVTTGNAMKHRWMVKSDGTLDFTNIDNLIPRLQAAGLGLYGHTLVWHSNQNASYLNGLIAPVVIPAPAGSNLLDLTGLKDKSLASGWNPQNKGAGISVVDGKGLSSTSQAVEMIASSSSSQAYNLQLISPDIAAVSGHTYEISFYIRSDQPGKGRVSFSGLENNYPYKDWYNTGGSWTESFETTSEWKQVLFTVNDFSAATFKMQFDFGYLPDVTYYIDVDNIWVRDLDAEPTVVNLLTNGTFDSNIEGWSRYNGAADCMSQATGTEAYQGGGSLKIQNAADGNEWDTQIHADFTTAWELNKKYKVSFMIRSDAVGSMRCSTTGTARYQGTVTTGATWTEVVWEVTGNGGETGLNLDMGKVAGTYYIDNVVVEEVAATKNAIARASATIVEKTDEEKAEIIGAAMESWISEMVGHCKTIVKGWDVVNEPMDDGKPSSIKTGVGKTDIASDEFYWQDYLGKDYAVTAFKLARKYGNPDDKLFINDYNLEYNLAKCDGLIAYVNYIEGKGAVVDGIGTQMHIAIDTNKDNIAQMFQKLGATGKLIKVTELDIKLNTSSPTAEQLAAQAEMYQYVIDMFKKHVPPAQQYAITLWGVSDNPKEHEYWIPDDGPNVWDANYQRKHAYKGVADGLAGKDVSEDFTGELQ
ncbi:endo-1,4-beta-xylanase [Dysgonomonas sp. PFB1-18]|uniref:endo-1,4-beta-xylanase n=1 Tax=unclassified Dysgonomonas TaxID=2630389 RepID=UPI0024771E7A|nr:MULTISPECIES: endo-1,4-beta-xylanase [unclassified Dysgonomonas]MDH6310120.1 endo-1,4-beta-xylanase [Dysgonomonas sp. PF1-14]MDH6340214.1 endo-1,4-beta-xylanase [Dysgonomonas sp. PF1-16]MDH6381677.1 endo-1,4-beta-xylanase [Dysgonomonas sp. PFB1-18]MDH6399036.1 endo-1,4-beta-xylanase [Dysgonomonas sp. PF1-23]